MASKLISLLTANENNKTVHLTEANKVLNEKAKQTILKNFDK